MDRRAPLVPIGSLITCTSSDWPSCRIFSIGRCRAAVAVLPVLPDVGDVQERRALEADLDERALHAGQHPRDAAEVDVADEAARAGALDVQLLHDALLEHRDARFLGGYVDEDFMRHGRRHGRAASHGPAVRGEVDAVIARAADPREQRRRFGQRQAHDAGIAAFEPRDECRGAALDRVAAGLVERLAGGDVALDLVARRARGT